MICLFKKQTYHFEVVEELYPAKPEHSYAGKKISVDNAYFEKELYVHQLYYLEGSQKSWMEYEYSTAANFEKSKELIIFLRRTEPDGKSFSYVCNNAHESVSKKNKALQLIKSRLVNRDSS